MADLKFASCKAESTSERFISDTRGLHASVDLGLNLDFQSDESFFYVPAVTICPFNTMITGNSILVALVFQTASPRVCRLLC